MTRRRGIWERLAQELPATGADPPSPAAPASGPVVVASFRCPRCGAYCPHCSAAPDGWAVISRPEELTTAAAWDALREIEPPPPDPPGTPPGRRHARPVKRPTPATTGVTTVVEAFGDRRIRPVERPGAPTASLSEAVGPDLPGRDGRPEAGQAPADPVLPRHRRPQPVPGRST